ncbi:MAG: glutaredoxin family protein [Polyangiales bacterium]
MTDRCERHGLSLAPDGSCVLCRRESSGAEAGDGGAKGGGIVPRLVLLGFGALAVVAALGLRAFLARAPGAAASSTVAPGASAPSLPEAAPVAIAPPARGPSAPDGEAERMRAKEEAERRYAAALEAARAEVRIEVFGASWCPACRRARTYLRDHRIAFRDLDVDHDRAASARLGLLNPRRTIPTMDIDGRVLVGFSPEGLEAAISEAAARRVRPTGQYAY